MDILALLDKPSVKSLGMVPFVGCTSVGSLVLSPAPKRETALSAALVNDLCVSGHALDVRNAHARVAEEPAGRMAGWLGAEFAEACRGLGLALPDLPDARHELPPLGTFWIDTPQRIFQVLLEWVQRAAPRAFRGREAAVADLMAWALPNLDETRAAVWWTRGSEEASSRYLAGLSRVSVGGKTITDIVGYRSILASIVALHVARPTSGE